MSLGLDDDRLSFLLTLNIIDVLLIYTDRVLVFCRSESHNFFLLLQKISNLVLLIKIFIKIF